ncbi:hypothetical protein KKF84_20285, partial [Myxococcota bacterium]|nr:hypothetical protein [Myxococcota bacterium]
MQWLVLSLLLTVTACDSPDRSRSEEPARRPGEKEGSFAKRLCLTRPGASEPCVTYARHLAFATGGLRRDVKAATTRLRNLCEKKVIAACTLLGEWYHFGSPLSRSSAKARYYLQQSCGGKSPLGCTLLAETIMGTGASRDVLLRLFTIGCAGKIPRACLRAGQTTRSIGSRESLWWFEEGCRLKDPASCTELAVNLLETHQAGTSSRAMKILHGECDGKWARACYLLSSIHPDSPRAHGFLERSCALRFAPACGLMGRRNIGAAKSDKERARAISTLHLACHQDDRDSCLFLAKMYQKTATTGSDRTRVIDYLVRACLLDHLASCENLFHYATSLADPLKRRWTGSLIRRGCDTHLIPHLCFLASILPHPQPPR